MRAIPAEKILGSLEHHYLRMTHTASQDSLDSSFFTVAENIYAEFRSVMQRHGDIADASAMKDLCASLDAAEARVAASFEVPPAFLRRIDLLRREVRRTLEEQAGWRSEPMIKGNKPTAAGLRGLNAARAAIGEPPLHLHGEEYLTAEEQRASLAIAAILGEVALADYWSAVAPERFAFNDRSIQNLRSWIGDVQAYSGGFVEDIPVALLTLPSLRCLRELLFAALRDRYHSEYYRDSVQGVDPVLQALIELRGRVDETARQTFIDELVDYFIEIDTMELPSRLKPGMGKGEEFPSKHQKIAMKEIERQRQLLLADPTGGGKTGACIAAFERMRDQGKAHRMLIMCPTGITGEWEKRLSDENDGYFATKPSVVVIRAGDPERARKWEEAKTADYVIMGIELAKEETGGKSHVELARGIGADFFVVDEAHNVRNPDGKDTERIFQISQCDSIRGGCTVAATATPVWNTIEDIAALLRLLNAGQDRLKDAQGIPEGVDFSDITSLTRAIGRNHTRMVRNLVKLRMLRRAPRDCLPVGTNLIEHAPVETPLSLLEQEIYEAMLEMPFFESALDKLRMLERACTHGAPEDPQASVVGSTKLSQIKDAVLQRLADRERAPERGSDKIVLAFTGQEAGGVTRDWNNDNHPETSAADTYLMGRLRKRLQAKGIAVFILDGSNTGSAPLRGPDGGILLDRDGAPLTATRRIIAQFRDHEGPAVLALRSDVAGQGIDLSFSNHTIIVSPDTVRSREIQQIGRQYRKGQIYDVEVWHLILEATIERGKWEYARRKQRIIEDLLDGKPLNPLEIQILHEETKHVRRGGSLAYESLTPRQKVTYLFNKMFNQGKERVLALLSADGGRYGRELARLYRQVEELGTQGNNRRLLLALLQKHAPYLRQEFGQSLEIADIAAGTMGIARSLQHDPHCTVWSSDICGAMLEAGKLELDPTPKQERIAECAMDELPYASKSKHVAFHSLALDCTRHNERTAAKGNGGERVRSLLELHRVLCDGGIAVIGLQRALFADQAAFDVFCKALESHFGFKVITEDTGFAYSADHPDEELFEGAVITLRKTGEARARREPLPMDAWMALNFFRKAHLVRAKKERFPRLPSGKAPPPPGAFHQEFTIGNQRVGYVPIPSECEEQSRHESRKSRYRNVHESIQRLIQHHGSMKAIPAEELLSLSLDDISTSSQSIRDRYFRELLLKYKGKIENIPLEEISGTSPVILVRMYEKKIGWYLVLATVDPEKRKLGTYGKKYFLEQEFAKDVAVSSH